MAQLKFKVHNQKITRIDVFKPVAKSKNYLYAEFIPATEEWVGKSITALFTKDDKSYIMLLDTNNTCLIPWEVLAEPGKVYVSCFCDDLITVNKSLVTVGETGYTEEIEEQTEPTPYIYNQITTSLYNLQHIIDELQATISSGKIDVDGGLFTDWEDE